MKFWTKFFLLFFIFCRDTCDSPSSIPTYSRNHSIYEFLIKYDETHNASVSYFYSRAMEKFQTFPLRKDTVKELVFSQGGKIFFVFGCYHLSRQAIVKFVKDVLPHIENPEEWLFLIEGSSQVSPFLPEVVFFTQVALDLEIPIEDPIVSVIGKEIIDSLTHTPYEMITPRDIFYALFNEIIKSPDIYERMSPQKKRIFLRIFSKYSGIPKDSIERFLEEYLMYFKGNPWRLKLAQKYFEQIKEDMIKKSNELSFKKLKKIIEEYDEKKYIFVYVGMYHLVIFENL